MTAKPSRIITNLCSRDLSRSQDFYTKLLGLELQFSSDWYVQLALKEPHIELGLIKIDHEMVPEAFRGQPQGCYLTFVVDSADESHILALEEGFTVLETPKDTFYGQRRMLIQAPEGTLVDISSPIPGFTFDNPN